MGFVFYVRVLFLRLVVFEDESSIQRRVRVGLYRNSVNPN